MARTTRYQAAIIREQRILLIQHHEYANGRTYWLLPGGGIEDGETEIECVQREVREETHLEVAVDGLLLDEPGHMGESAYQRFKTYLCRPLAGEPRPGIEPEPEAAMVYAITDVGWYDIYDESTWSELIVDDPITSSMLRRVRAALEQTSLMSPGHRLVFETERLMVRTATEEDVGLFYALWTHPQVMRNVGFPQGLRVTRSELKERLSRQGRSEFERLLVVELKATGQAIGECKLSDPDEEGIAEPDIKLLPEFWGHKYGVEAWRELVAYQFIHTDCDAVQATPNVENGASIKMQEALGGVRIGEDVYQFPESMRGYTTPVHHYIYRVYRADWERRGLS